MGNAGFASGVVDKMTFSDLPVRKQEVEHLMHGPTQNLIDGYNQRDSRWMRKFSSRTVIIFYPVAEFGGNNFELGTSLASALFRFHCQTHCFCMML